MLIERWYRREAALKYKWGMCRYTETEVRDQHLKAR